MAEDPYKDWTKVPIQEDDPYKDWTMVSAEPQVQASKPPEESLISSLARGAENSLLAGHAPEVKAFGNVIRDMPINNSNEPMFWRAAQGLERTLGVGIPEILSHAEDRPDLRRQPGESPSQQYQRVLEQEKAEAGTSAQKNPISNTVGGFVGAAALPLKSPAALGTYGGISQIGKAPPEASTSEKIARVAAAASLGGLIGFGADKFGSILGDLETGALKRIAQASKSDQAAQKVQDKILDEASLAAGTWLQKNPETIEKMMSSETDLPGSIMDKAVVAGTAKSLPAEIGKGAVKTAAGPVAGAVAFKIAHVLGLPPEIVPALIGSVGGTTEILGLSSAVKGSPALGLALKALGKRVIPGTLKSGAETVSSSPLLDFSQSEKDREAKMKMYDATRKMFGPKTGGKD